LHAIVRAGIRRVSATALIDRALRSVRFGAEERLCVVSAGKAANAMAMAAAGILGGRIRTGLVASHVDGEAPSRFEVIRGGHPVPTADSERAGRRALDLAASIGPGESLLILLSGGGSAIMAVPASGVTIDDKRRTTDRLLKAGADIYALNTVRKHVSALKGGWLAARTARPSMTFAISDVVGDDLSVIASGPTVPDASTFEDALEVLRRFGGLDAYPSPVVDRLHAGIRGEVPETPKPGDLSLKRATAEVIGSRRDAMEGAACEAEARGYAVVQFTEPVVGEARIAAVSHLRTALARAADLRRPVCLISSGETTVRVTGDGKGGRNQEFVLALVEPLSVLGSPVMVASAGTDGIDGPTEAAGAVADHSTLERARARGLGWPARFLDNNDAHAFFEPLDDLIITGPTDTNVGDLQVILFG
jgi:glycerate 2-kinase